jgi:hypothetical protein
VNQATAKATLTQIINIVYKRFELDVERWGAQNLVISETAEVSDLSPNRVSVEELEHLAEHSDIKRDRYEANYWSKRCTTCPTYHLQDVHER